MLVIRLARTGRNKYPTYRIVAADSKRAATGKFVMILGHYNPHTKELVIKREETAKYISSGAQPSNAVIKLMKQEKIDLPEWVVLKTRNRKAKKEVAPEVPVVVAPEVAASAEPTAEPTEAAAVEASADAVVEVAPEATKQETIAVVAEEEAEAVGDNVTSVNQADTAESDSSDAVKAKANAEVGAESAAESEAA